MQNLRFRQLAWVRWILVGCAFLSCATFAKAQISAGTILGTVTDSSGAVVTGASVTVTNQDSGAQRHIESDAHGAYSIPLLQPGMYTITVAKGGFSEFKQTG